VGRKVHEMEENLSRTSHKEPERIQSFSIKKESCHLRLLILKLQAE
jgi:hypothetical protein